MRKYNLIVILSLVCLALSSFIIYRLGFTKDLSSKPVVASVQKEIIENEADKTNNPKKTTIILTGDVMLGRGVMEKSMGLHDPNYPFEKVADKLNKADLVFVNLENPVVKNCPFTDSGFKFCTAPKMIDGLKYAHIGVVNLANNHTLNYGIDGRNATINFLRESDIAPVGYGYTAIKDINGIKFGFMGFDFVTFGHDLEENDDSDLIKKFRNEVDVLIIAVHWGEEYQSVPNSYQKKMAKELINDGADIVVGSHPHWVQSEENIDGRLVFYSLGNFVFDQMWSEETRNGLAIRLTYNGGDLVKEEQLPVYMTNFAQPEWVVGR